jgi:hypothetical protein
MPALAGGIGIMKVDTARQPVIILGMHRSGTSMVSELLDQLGLFVGKELQDDHESTYFLDLNDIILSRVNASWDHPLPVLDFFKCDEAVRMTAEALAADVSSSGIKKFLGKGRLTLGLERSPHRFHLAAVAEIVPRSPARLHRPQRD